MTIMLDKLTMINNQKYCEEKIMPTALFMPLDGAKGESADANQAEHSDVQNLSWDVNQNVATARLWVSSMAAR
jgi:ABC-type transport system involved in cytochrome c biogenesis ATPase subunit